MGMGAAAAEGHLQTMGVVMSSTMSAGRGEAHFLPQQGADESTEAR